MEKALVEDLARCICDAKSAHRGATRELAAAREELAHLKREALERRLAQARELEAAREGHVALQRQIADVALELLQNRCA